MSSGRSIRAGKAFVELNAKDKVSAVLGKVGGLFKKFTQLVGEAFKVAIKVTLAWTAATVAAIRTFAKLGDEIQKAAIRTGLGAEELSLLKEVAREADVAFQELQDGIFRAQRMRPGATFAELADEVAAAGDAGEQTRLAYDIFGRSAQKLLPLLKQGGNAIREQQQAMKREGFGITQEQADAAAQLSDSFGKVVGQIKMIVFQYGAWANETFNVTDGLNSISQVLAAVLKFIKAGEIGDAWGVMWRSMAQVVLTNLQFIITPIADTLDWIVDKLKWVTRQVISSVIPMVQLFDEELARTFRKVQGEFARPTNVNRAIERLLKENEKRLAELNARAAKLGLEPIEEKKLAPSTEPVEETVAEIREKILPPELDLPKLQSVGTFNPMMAIRMAAGSGSQFDSNTQRRFQRDLLEENRNTNELLMALVMNSRTKGKKLPWE